MIRVLPPHLANQIAAGEVVERPASVVKELVENAVDAGADAISVSLTDGGLTSIIVTDNGSGIPKEDCPTAFLRHATSKISTQEDLQAIGTLGFRGEALASIGAVSLITLTTRTKSSESGTKLLFDNGKVLSNEDCSCVFGTVIRVDNLFAKVPARLKFMKSPRTEAGYVGDFMAKMILNRPDIAFRFTSNDKAVYETYGDGSLKNAVFSVYGSTVADRLLPVAFDNGYLKIEGYIGTQELSRPNRSLESVFVNGRYIRSAALLNAVQKAYDTRMMAGRYPFALLKLTIAKAEVDVNVHPAKTEVRFLDSARVEWGFTAACAAALREPIIPKAVFPEKPVKPEKKETTPLEQPDRLPDYRQSSGERVNWAQKSNISVPPAHEMREAAEYRYNSFEKRKQTESTAGGEEPDTPDTIEVFAVKGNHPVAIESKPRQDALPMDFAVNILGCAFNTYWIVQHEDCLYLIDQHAAHERRLYESFISRKVETASQELLVLQNVTMQPREFEMAMEFQPLLEELGYRFEKAGALSVNLTAVPVLNGAVFDGETLHQAINAIGEAGRGAAQALVREKLISSSCKHAVKAGETLQKAEIVALLQAYADKGIPLTCPHGRPVVTSISRREIEKLFKRIL